MREEKVPNLRLELGRFTVSAAVEDVEIDLRIGAERRAQELGVMEANLLVLTAGDEEHGNHHAGDRIDRRRPGDIGSEEHERRESHQVDERPVGLPAEETQVGERRVGGDGLDARILRGREQRHRSAEREAEDSHARVATAAEPGDGTLEIAALAEAERGRAAAALAEVAQVHKQDGEARRQSGRERQEVRLVRGIAVKEHDRRRRRPGDEPPCERDAILRANANVLDA